MSLVSLANSSWGPRAGLLLARLLPAEVAYWIAGRVMGSLARRADTPLVRAIRSNQAGARNLPLKDPGLDKAVAEVLVQAGHGYVDWFKGLAGGRAAIRSMVEIDPVAEDSIRTHLGQGRGVLFAGAHMNGFNLYMLRLCDLTPDFLVLTLSDPQGSHDTENKLRLAYGMPLEPVSMASLRKAIKILSRGGMVATLVDRPDPAGSELRFFGRPTRLPIGHARLALRAKARVFVADGFPVGRGRYRLQGTTLDPQWRGPTNEMALVGLAQEVLSLLEADIRRRPSSWLMFHKLWSDSLADEARTKPVDEFGRADNGL